MLCCADQCLTTTQQRQRALRSHGQQPIWSWQLHGCIAIAGDSPCITGSIYKLPVIHYVATRVAFIRRFTMYQLQQDASILSRNPADLEARFHKLFRGPVTVTAGLSTAMFVVPHNHPDWNGEWWWFINDEEWRICADWWWRVVDDG